MGFESEEDSVIYWEVNSWKWPDTQVGDYFEVIYLGKHRIYTQQEKQMFTECLQSPGLTCCSTGLGESAPSSDPSVVGENSSVRGY
jgi:hypothetical protein